MKKYSLIEVAFDIETVPAELPPELESELIPNPAPETISPPSNWKDPVKIQEYIDKKSVEQVEKIEKEKQEVRESFSLSPMTGRVACACLFPVYYESGIRVHDGGIRVVDLDEKVLLLKFWSMLAMLREEAYNLKIVSYNGKEFDGHFLRVRSAINGVKMPFRIDQRRFTTDPHFDVREVLTNFGANKKGKLGQWAAAFGLGKKLTEGSKVKELWDAGKYEELCDYCLQDCIITHQMFKKLEHYV